MDLFDSFFFKPWPYPATAGHVVFVQFAMISLSTFFCPRILRWCLSANFLRLIFWTIAAVHRLSFASDCRNMLPYLICMSLFDCIRNFLLKFVDLYSIPRYIYIRFVILSVKRIVLGDWIFLTGVLFSSWPLSSWCGQNHAFHFDTSRYASRLEARVLPVTWCFCSHSNRAIQ